jgi:hypothetical protein
MISEVDLQDFENIPVKPLYDVPRNSFVLFDNTLKLLFRKIDGAYSICETMTGDVVHLAAWTKVKVFPQ